MDLKNFIKIFIKNHRKKKNKVKQFDMDAERINKLRSIECFEKRYSSGYRFILYFTIFSRLINVRVKWGKYNIYDTLRWRKYVYNNTICHIVYWLFSVVVTTIRMAEEDGFRENFTSANKCPRQIKVQPIRNITLQKIVRKREVTS